MIGYNWNDRKKIYIADFGLAMPWKMENDEHIPFEENQPSVGTLRYETINSHKHYSTSRRDELESIGHVLIYFMKGKLPWQGLCPDGSEVTQTAAILAKKEATSID